MTNDEVSEDTEFFGFTISTPQGADLRGRRSKDVADLGLLDDDTRGVTVDPTSIGLDEPASGETAVAGAYTVNLNSRPTDTVTVTVGGSDPAVSLSGDTLTNNQLTFTTTNWNTAQTITVTPVKDDNAVGETITLNHTLSGGDYAGIAADSVTVNLTDSDTRNLVLSKQSLTVTEGDAAGVQYTVKLATQPSDTVTVTISGHEGADLTLSGTTLTNNQLTFTTANWGTAQTVAVKAGDDANDDNESETLSHTAFGGDYVNVTKDLPVSITDDDSAGVTVTPPTLTIDEGATSTYTVVLDSEPTATTTVTVNDPSNTDVTAEPESLTFTTESWDTEQTVTVSAGQDEDSTEDTATVTHTVASADSDYQGAAASDVIVTVTDADDIAGVTISETELTIEEGGSDTYTVVLDSEPTATTTVTVNDPSNTDVTAEPESLTFTTESWDTEQTVMITAGQDEDSTGDTATVTHTVASADSGYQGAAASDVIVTVTDADDPAVSVSFGQGTYSATEGGGVEVSVILSVAPERRVVIPITRAGRGGATSTDYSGVPDSVTFESVDTEKRFTLTAIDDDVDDDGESVKLTFGELPDRVTEGSVSTTTVTITDDDIAGVTISETELTIEEGGSDTYTVVLDSEPTATTTVTVNDPSNTDVTAEPESLTFTTESWDTEQTVMITAGQDEDSTGDTATVTHTVASADSDYQGAAASDVIVTVTDADDPAVSVSFGQGTYSATEGGGVEVSVILSVAPERRAVVPLTRTNQHEASDADYSGVPDSVTFESVDTEKSFTLTAIDDDVDDDGESVKLTFGSLPPGVSGGATTEAIVTISDNDGPADSDSQIGMPMVTLKVTPSVIEEQGGARSSTATVTASLDRPSAADTMVTISTDPSAATWFALSTNKDLTILAGDSTSTGMVTVTAMNGDDFGDYQVLTVEGTARNNGGANGPDPVTLTVFAKDVDVIPYQENGTGPVMTFTSTDPENGQPGEGIDWDLTGFDADDFLIDARGMLIFRRPPTSRTRRTGRVLLSI